MTKSWQIRGACMAANDTMPAKPKVIIEFICRAPSLFCSESASVMIGLAPLCRKASKTININSQRNHLSTVNRDDGISGRQQTVFFMRITPWLFSMDCFQRRGCVTVWFSNWQTACHRPEPQHGFSCSRGQFHPGGFQVDVQLGDYKLYTSSGQFLHRAKHSGIIIPNRYSPTRF